MSAPLPHTVWLNKTGHVVTTSDGVSVDVFELQIDFTAAPILCAWAISFREHYCLDAQIDRLRRGTGKSRSDYLTDMVFPDSSNDFGPATRSGDFAEILIADLLESQYGFWAPRTRYDDKLVRNESPKGTDVLAFKFHGTSPSHPSQNDVLVSFESKAQLSGSKAKPRLQDAVKDSVKDIYRISESLNAIKRRLINRGDEGGADRIERFQDGLEIPYVRMTGAAAVFCSSVYDPVHISETTNCAGHENVDKLMLIVVHANALMELVHALYRKAAIEA